MQAMCAQASRSTVGSLFRERARIRPADVAVETAAGLRRTYGELNERVNRAAASLRAWGVLRGERVAVLSANRPEYLELQLACAKLGAMVACQNVRLPPSELRHCVDLVAPRVAVATERYRSLWTQSQPSAPTYIELGEQYEECLAKGLNRAAAPRCTRRWRWRMKS